MIQQWLLSSDRIQARTSHVRVNHITGLGTITDIRIQLRFNALSAECAGLPNMCENHGAVEHKSWSEGGKEAGARSKCPMLFSFLEASKIRLPSLIVILTRRIVITSAYRP